MANLERGRKYENEKNVIYLLCCSYGGLFSPYLWN